MIKFIQYKKEKITIFIFWGLGFILFLMGLLIWYNKNLEQDNIDSESIKKYIPIKRNFDNIQFADFRKNFDPLFNKLADDLSNAYYNFWKKGLNKSWQGYDKQPTLAESKELFDQLQGLIWHWYNVEFDRQNKLQPLDKQIPETEYNYVYDSQGKIKYKKSEYSKQIIEEYRQKGIEIKIK